MVLERVARKCGARLIFMNTRRRFFRWTVHREETNEIAVLDKKKKTSPDSAPVLIRRGPEQSRGCFYADSPGDQFRGYPIQGRDGGGRSTTRSPSLFFVGFFQPKKKEKIILYTTGRETVRHRGR